jgi:GGDEF domain-containing protein
MYDTLTGLWNRHTILEALHRELERARRESKALCGGVVEPPVAQPV